MVGCHLLSQKENFSQANVFSQTFEHPLVSSEKQKPIMPFPTSRKKYYLSIEIKPEWTDSELIAELKEHVESRTSESVRDIFLPHSERIGTF